MNKRTFQNLSILSKDISKLKVKLQFCPYYITLKQETWFSNCTVFYGSLKKGIIKFIQNIDIVLVKVNMKKIRLIPVFTRGTQSQIYVYAYIQFYVRAPMRTHIATCPRAHAAHIPLHTLHRPFKITCATRQRVDTYTTYSSANLVITFCTLNSINTCLCCKIILIKVYTWYGILLNDMLICLSNIYLNLLGTEGSETREWEESRGDDEAAAVSSQGSEPSSPHQV